MLVVNLTTLNYDELSSVVHYFKFDPLTLGKFSQVSKQCRDAAASARENVVFGALGLRPIMRNWELRARFGVESVDTMRKLAPKAGYTCQTLEVVSKMLVEYGGWDALYKRAIAHAPAIEKARATKRSKIESLLTRRVYIDDMIACDYAKQTGQWMARDKSAVASLEEWEREYNAELKHLIAGKRLYRYLNQPAISINRTRLAEAVDQMRELQVVAVTRYAYEHANIARVRWFFVDQLKAANCQTMEEAQAWFDHRPSLHSKIAIISSGSSPLTLEDALLTDDEARAAARHLTEVDWPSHVALTAEFARMGGVVNARTTHSSLS
jgi:hypothetical protein